MSGVVTPDIGCAVCVYGLEDFALICGGFTDIFLMSCSYRCIRGSMSSRVKPVPVRFAIVIKDESEWHEVRQKLF